MSGRNEWPCIKCLKMIKGKDYLVGPTGKVCYLCIEKHQNSPEVLIPLLLSETFRAEIESRRAI